MFLLFGLLTAVSFGVADFLAGLAGRRMSALALVLYSQSIGAAMIIPVALIFGARPGLEEVIWGGAAGIVLGLGFVLYYRALAQGRMGVVAAVTGVWTAVAPFAVGLYVGERPSAVTLLGIMGVVVAIALVSAGGEHGGDATRSETQDRHPSARSAALPLSQRGCVVCDSGIVHATLAGLWMGLFFVFLDQPQSGSPLWPAASATLASALVVACLVPVLRPRLGAPSASLWLIAAVGLSQTLGTLTFVIAAREGMLSVVAVAGALTPIPTAILAFLILRERATRLQLAGIVTAVIGIAMMAYP